MQKKKCTLNIHKEKLNWTIRCTCIWVMSHQLIFLIKQQNELKKREAKINL